MIVALAGGVGGAKLALGLSHVLPPEALGIGVNTGDDFVHLGLHISPDLDTVTYTLAGIENPATGWGIANETWSFMDMIERLGGETWFKLGDRDVALHLERTRRLAQGGRLSEITSEFFKRLGVRHRILPMSNAPVRTMIVSGGARIAFQDYFVRLRCTPVVNDIIYDGADEAEPLPALLDALSSDALKGIIICPSNPYLSIGPMLAMPALANALKNRSRPVVAVSPIIGGKAVKGPAAKILRELGQEPSCLTVAQYYRGLIDYVVVDKVDAEQTPRIRALGIEPVVTNTLMRDLNDRCRLAEECCEILHQA